MPDKRGTLYEQLAREASKTLVQTRFNIAFRQTLDAYKKGFLAGAKNGYIYGYIVLAIQCRKHPHFNAGI